MSELMPNIHVPKSPAISAFFFVTCHLGDIHVFSSREIAHAVAFASICHWEQSVSVVNCAKLLHEIAWRLVPSLEVSTKEVWNSSLYRRAVNTPYCADLAWLEPKPDTEQPLRGVWGSWSSRGMLLYIVIISEQYLGFRRFLPPSSS